MSYAGVYDLGKEKIAFAKRDAIRFQEFGYNSDKIAETEALVEQLRTTERDAELLGEQVRKTHERNTLDTLVRANIRKIQVRLETVYSESNPTFLSLFKVSDLSKITYSELILEGERILRKCRTYSSELTVNGITETLVNEFENVLSQLRETSIDQKLKVADRDYASGNRLQLANNVYKQIFDICAIGKAIWIDENEALYNDYVIYENQYSTPEVTEEVPEIPPTIEPIPVLG